MKLRTIVFLILAVIVVLAVYTKPGTDAFREYYTKGEQQHAPPVIEYKNCVAYAVFSVRTYATADNHGKPVAVPLTNNTYIGLFGHFWKL